MVVFYDFFISYLSRKFWMSKSENKKIAGCPSTGQPAEWILCEPQDQFFDFSFCGVTPLVLPLTPLTVWMMRATTRYGSALEAGRRSSR